MKLESDLRNTKNEIFEQFGTDLDFLPFLEIGLFRFLNEEHRIPKT
ncbi:MAG: hypothetical protein ACI8YP_003232 [Algoriphagus sp.]|jgi:hypothetical protein